MSVSRTLIHFRQVVILQLRLYAMYAMNKKLLVIMGSLFILTSAIAATMVGIVVAGNIQGRNANPSSSVEVEMLILGSFVARAHAIPGLPFCVLSGISVYFYAFWIPPLAFELLLCGLALFRGFQTFYSRGPRFRSGKHLIEILIRDSILYFIMCVPLTNIQFPFCLCLWS